MLEREDRGAVACLTLDRADKLNALPRSFWAELTDTMRGVEAEPAIRAVVIHGAGKCFSVGGDIEDFRAIGGIADRRAYMAEALGAFRAVEALTKPVIAAVHGHALGGGCELTMVCDLVVADETACFGTPESAVGLVPGLGVVRGLAHVNLHWMKYMVMTGLPITAQQALVAGLVNVVVEPGQHLAEAGRLADVVVSRSPLALAVGKSILGRHGGEGFGYAQDAISLLQSAEDFAEGMAAFSERRPAVFPDAPATRDV
jgi:enoyl-CoA hydratase/carnithine racemase